uniref:Uncharacterized protein n=1 Tax=Aegilops tauschii subsp. strangulata TaxID=200361 RepID=A0A453MFI4_AEGTS
LGILFCKTLPFDLVICVHYWTLYYLRICIVQILFSIHVYPLIQ